MEEVFIMGEKGGIDIRKKNRMTTAWKQIKLDNRHSKRKRMKIRENEKEVDSSGRQRRLV